MILTPRTLCPHPRRAMTGGVIRATTLEALRRTLRRKIKKSSKLWICISPSIPVSRKPAETRMGKGKGAVKFWAVRVRPGQIIFEMDRLPRPLALAAVDAIQQKIPVKVGFLEWS
jgi:large subunit ribosomal protein L16